MLRESRQGTACYLSLGKAHRMLLWEWTRWLQGARVTMLLQAVRH